jgi:hypothetical protein
MSVCLKKSVAKGKFFILIVNAQNSQWFEVISTCRAIHEVNVVKNVTQIIVGCTCAITINKRLFSFAILWIAI